LGLDPAGLHLFYDAGENNPALGGSDEGHSKTALAKPFGSLLFPASRSSVCSRGVAVCSALMLPARITSELSWQLGD